jgi:SAM-dependent methyltransferase
MGLVSSLIKRTEQGKILLGEVDALKSERNELKEVIKRQKKEIKDLRAQEGYPPLASLHHAGQMRAAMSELLATDAMVQSIPFVHDLAIRLNLAVSDKDIMLKKSTSRHYLSTGFSALDSIHRCIPSLKDYAPLRILDFGCGYGRVLRMLRAAWSHSVLTACDVEPDGLAFCMEHFDISGFRSQIKPTAIPMAHGFDLIWVGSLITHLNEDAIMGYISLFRHLLEPDGHVVFTTHGEHVVNRLKKGEFHYDLSAEKIRSIIRSYDSGGYGYEDYPTWAGYGVSATSAAWLRPKVEALGRMRFRAHLPHHWDNHQDVWCFQKE